MITSRTFSCSAYNFSVTAKYFVYYPTRLIQEFRKILSVHEAYGDSFGTYHMNIMNV